jgi:hypothetical protein
MADSRAEKIWENIGGYGQVGWMPRLVDGEESRSCNRNLDYPEAPPLYGGGSFTIFAASDDRSIYINIVFFQLDLFFSFLIRFLPVLIAFQLLRQGVATRYLSMVIRYWTFPKIF